METWGSYLGECVYTQDRPLKHVVSSLSAVCRPVANALVCRGGNRDLLVAFGISGVVSCDLARTVCLWHGCYRILVFVELTDDFYINFKCCLKPQFCSCGTTAEPRFHNGSVKSHYASKMGCKHLVDFEKKPSTRAYKNKICICIILNVILVCFIIRNLSYNNLTKLSENSFAKLVNLISLRLGHNFISHITEGAFRGLNTLRTL